MERGFIDIHSLAISITQVGRCEQCAHGLVMSGDEQDESFSTLVKHLYSNVTAKEVVQNVIQTLDADISEIDPVIAAAMSVILPMCCILILVCCVCCGRWNRVPNAKASKLSEEIIGDDEDEFDPEAVHTDPKVSKIKGGRRVSKRGKRYSDIDDAGPISPVDTESGDDQDNVDGEGRVARKEDDGDVFDDVTPSVGAPKTSFDRDSKACCSAVASCLEREL